jgi:hypothetical protein
MAPVMVYTLTSWNLSQLSLTCGLHFAACRKQALSLEATLMELWGITLQLSPGFVMQLVLIDLLFVIYLDSPWVSLSPALFPQSSQEIT